MSTASPSVPSTSATQYGASSVHTAQPQANHGGTPSMHNHAGTTLTASDPHVGHGPGTAGLYQDSVGQGPHHIAGSFAGTQLTPMTSPYGTAAYGAAQHPMYSTSYTGHPYAPYPNYFGHISHYGAHPPHYASAGSSPAYHTPIMSSMIPHSAYNPHAASHMPTHHAPTTAVPIPMASSSAGTATPAGPSMASNAMMPTSTYGSASQYSAPVPWTGRHRVTTTLWEDEGTLCFQVDVKGVCVARRHDNNMVNGTKLLNVCGMSRGKRDGILKNEKERIVVKVGAMHLKGVWIAFSRGKQLAEQHGIADILYPLFEPNIQSFLYHPDNYPRTAAVMAAAQERQAHRHYGMAGGTSAPVKDVNGNDISANIPLHSGLPHGHWSGSQLAHDASAASPAGTDTSMQYPYAQHHPHYHHQAQSIPPQAHTSASQAQTPTSGSATAPPGNVFSPPNPAYSAQAMQPAVRPAPTNMMMDRRLDQPSDASGIQPPGLSGAIHAPGNAANARRMPSLKRSASEHGAQLGDVPHHDEFDQCAGSTTAPGSVVSGNGPRPSTDSFATNALTTSNFSLDDMKLEKRQKIESPSVQPSSLDMVYPGESRASEPDSRPQVQEE